MEGLSWATIINAITDFVKTILKPLLKILSWLYSKSPVELRWRKQKPKLGIIPSTWRNHVWELRKQGNENIVVLDTSWEITNSLPYNLTTFNVCLVRPQKVKGSWMVKDVKSQYWGHYVIPKGYTTELNANFVINPRLVKDKKSSINAEIEIIDPINISHNIKDIVIEPLKRNIQKQDKLTIEDVSRLSGVEKSVVSVLKNEIEQYKTRGRREGRLGTVEWPRGTIEYRGMDEKIKYLFNSSSKKNVVAEYADAIVNLYKKSSKEDQQIIVKSLLHRIDKKTEYRNIAYLIGLILFEINSIELSLPFALKKLQGDKTNGFSDFLRLIDFLLAFRYDEFDEDLLDLS